MIWGLDETNAFVRCFRCHKLVAIEFDYWCIDCDGYPPPYYAGELWAYWGA